MDKKGKRVIRIDGQPPYNTPTPHKADKTKRIGKTKSSKKKMKNEEKSKK